MHSITSTSQKSQATKAGVVTSLEFSSMFVFNFFVDARKSLKFRFAIIGWVGYGFLQDMPVLSTYMTQHMSLLI